MTVGTSYYVICPFDKNGVVANYYGVTDKGLKFSTFKIPSYFGVEAASGTGATAVGPFSSSVQYVMCL